MYLQILGLVIIGVVLLYFGYSLFFGFGKGHLSGSGKKNKDDDDLEGEAGSPRTCPVCSIRLKQGERVKSSAFPAMGKADRLMYISGCFYCLEGDRPRVCPVCGAVLNYDENLIARLFDKPGRSHVHVLGCSHCRGPGANPLRTR
ncbi:hypothetical protein LQZ19_01810 [Treponema primitia]|uniref:hypothetical protein n=1 Tax=Treponema primitia TaxID=88058 RepID=UPI003980742E